MIKTYKCNWCGNTIRKRYFAGYEIDNDNPKLHRKNCPVRNAMEVRLSQERIEEEKEMKKKYGLIILGKEKPIFFPTQKERNRIARYLKNRVAYITMMEEVRRK